MQSTPVTWTLANSSCRLRAVSLFFFRFSKGSARARERWAAKPLPSRVFSHARGHLRVSRVLLNGPRKKKDCSLSTPAVTRTVFSFPSEFELLGFYFIWNRVRSGLRDRYITYRDQIDPTSCTFSERSFPSSVTIKSDPWFEFSEVQVRYRTRQICDTVRLRVFTRLICLFHLGLPSLPFLSSLVKPTATRSDFLHNPRKLQRAALASWFEPAIINGPAERLLLQICAKIRRGRDARMLFCLIYSCVPFPYIAFRIIISFRKPCHMPFRKLIPPFTLTVMREQVT